MTSSDKVFISDSAVVVVENWAPDLIKSVDMVGAAVFKEKTESEMQYKGP